MFSSRGDDSANARPFVMGGYDADRKPRVGYQQSLGGTWQGGNLMIAEVNGFLGGKDVRRVMEGQDRLAALVGLFD